MTQKKFAIVASGGGMACAFSAGALFAFAEKYPAIQPHILVGGSGCTGSFAYFLAGQYRELRHIWLHELSTPDYVSFRRLRRICDIDYLVDSVFGARVPLNTARVLSSSGELLFSTTNIRTGQFHFFDKKVRLYSK